MNRHQRWGFDPDQLFSPTGPLGAFGPVAQNFLNSNDNPGPGWGGPGWAGPGGRGTGRGPFGPGGFGPEGPGTGGPRGGRRARRGEVRGAILHLLSHGPKNGYQLMQDIADATAGEWTPSSGAIYPALAQLEDEGLIKASYVEGRKAFDLTDAGREALGSTPDPLATSTGGQEPEDPWAQDREARRERRRGHEHHGGPGGRRGPRQAPLWKAMGTVAMAAQAVNQTGDEELSRQATEVLDRTRRDLYRLLAESEVDRDPQERGGHGDESEEITEGELLD